MKFLKDLPHKKCFEISVRSQRYLNKISLRSHVKTFYLRSHFWKVRSHLRNEISVLRGEISVIRGEISVLRDEISVLRDEILVLKM